MTQNDANNHEDWRLSPSYANVPEGAEEYELVTTKHGLLNEKLEVYRDGEIIGQLERSILLDTWQGEVGGRGVAIACGEDPQLRLAYLNVSAEVTLHRTPSTFTIDGRTANSRGAGGGYAISQDGVDLGIYHPVWRDSDRERGIQARASVFAPCDEGTANSIALFLLFLCKVQDTSFPDL